MAYRVDSQLPPSNCWPFKCAQSTQQDVQAYQKEIPILSYENALFVNSAKQNIDINMLCICKFIVYTHRAVFLFVGLGQ